MVRHSLRRKSIRHTTPEKRKSIVSNPFNNHKNNDHENENENNNNNNDNESSFSSRRKSQRKSITRRKNSSSRVYEEQIQEVQVAVLGDHRSGKTSFITNCVIDPVQSCSSCLPSAVHSPLPSTTSSLLGSMTSTQIESEDEHSDLPEFHQEMNDDDDTIMNDYFHARGNGRRHSIAYLSRRRSSLMKNNTSNPSSSSSFTTENAPNVESSTTIHSSNTHHIPRNVSPNKNDEDTSLSSASDWDVFTQTVSAKNLRRKSRLLTELNTAIENFNEKPQHGMEYLSHLGIMSSKEAAQFLFYTASITPKAIGVFLGQNNAQIEAVRYEYVNMFEFRDKSYEESFRYFLANVSLPSESQQILRILETFGEVINGQNHSHIQGAPFVFNAETAYFLAFEILMLHSRIHKKSSTHRKLKRKEFIEKIRFINSDIPKWWSSAIYKDILRFPLRDPMMDPILKDGLSNPVYRRKFQYGPLVIDLCISEISLAESINLDYSTFDGFIVLFDITDRPSFETAKRFLKGIMASRSIPKPKDDVDMPATMLIGCKADRNNVRQISHAEALQEAKQASVEYMEVSNATPTSFNSSSSSCVSNTESSGLSSFTMEENDSDRSPDDSQEFSHDMNQPVTALETLAFNISEERMNQSYSNSPSARQSCLMM